MTADRTGGPPGPPPTVPVVGAEAWLDWNDRALPALVEHVEWWQGRWRWCVRTLDRLERVERVHIYQPERFHGSEIAAWLAVENNALDANKKEVERLLAILNEIDAARAGAKERVAVLRRVVALGQTVLSPTERAPFLAANRGPFLRERDD